MNKGFEKNLSEYEKIYSDLPIQMAQAQHHNNRN